MYNKRIISRRRFQRRGWSRGGAGAAAAAGLRLQPRGNGQCRRRLVLTPEPSSTKELAHRNGVQLTCLLSRQSASRSLPLSRPGELRTPPARWATGLSAHGGRWFAHERQAEALGSLAAFFPLLCPASFAGSERAHTRAERTRAARIRAVGGRRTARGHTCGLSPARLRCRCGRPSWRPSTRR